MAIEKTCNSCGITTTYYQLCCHNCNYQLCSKCFQRFGGDPYGGWGSGSKSITCPNCRAGVISHR